ncbi:MAG: rhodanese-like domain-containing protein [Planctomycetota bacterium]
MSPSAIPPVPQPPDSDRSRPASPLAAAALALLTAGVVPGQDSERATHADDAATPQVAFEHRGEGFVLRQYQLGCLSLLSYLVVAGNEAVVIDPQRDVDHYVADAAKLGATIRYVALTHPHADFVAGHTELAQRTGATILIGPAANAEFAHRAFRDGDSVAIASVRLVAWDTPGHTPNAQTFLLYPQLRGGEPAFAFTGDTLFIGSIGRPDLLDVPPAQLASQSFDSIRRLVALPPDTMILPAHGAGSLCGAHLSPETTSTIGEQILTNPYLQIESRTSFIANVISHQPVAPQYFAFNVEMNRKGPPLVTRSEELPSALEPAAALALHEAGEWFVDLRSQEDYAKGHVPGSINVALRGRLDTWTGIVVPFGAKLVLVGAVDEVKEGVFRLRRIGYDAMAGFLAGGMEAWTAAGNPVRTSKLVKPRELSAAIAKGEEPMIIDVRTAEEYEDLRLGDVGNIAVTDYERFAKILDRTQPVVMACNSAYRSSMAIGLAERMGFADVASLDGGLDAWIDAGLPVRGRMAPQATATTVAPRAASQPLTAIRMPEAIEAAGLARALMDQPEAYRVIDLRPDWQFAEWSIVGSENRTVAETLSEGNNLAAGRRLVLVDRDGTHAFAVAGALMATHHELDVRVLVGGVAGYYASMGWNPSSRDGDSNPPEAGPMNPGADRSTKPADTTSNRPIVIKKKRNAGC